MSNINTMPFNPWGYTMGDLRVCEGFSLFTLEDEKKPKSSAPTKCIPNKIFKENIPKTRLTNRRYFESEQEESEQIGTIMPNPVVVKTEKVVSQVIESSPKAIFEVPLLSTKVEIDFKTLVQTLRQNPAQLLEIDFQKSNLTEHQKSICVQNALVTCILDKTEHALHIHARAKELLPQDDSKIGDFDSFIQYPCWTQILENDDIYPEILFSFYENNVLLSYSQVVELLNTLTRSSSQMMSCTTIAFAALALLPIPRIADALVNKEFTAIKYLDTQSLQKVHVNLIYMNCMTYHRDNIEILQKGYQSLNTGLFYASDSVKESKALEPYWLDLALQKDIDGVYSFEKPQYPEKYKNRILSDYHYLTLGVRNDHLFIFHVHPSFQKDQRYKTLFKSTLFGVMHEDTAYMPLETAQHVYDLKDSILPKNPSKISNQSDFVSFLEKYPIEVLLWKDKDELNDLLESNFDLNFTQFIESLTKISKISNMKGAKNLALYKQFAFTSLVTVPDICGSIISTKGLCDLQTLQLIVKVHSSDKDLIQHVAKEDRLGRPIYFADDSIRYAPENKKWLINSVIDLIETHKTKALKLPRFPTHLLKEREVVNTIKKLKISI